MELLRTVGLGDRMDAEGLEHGGIYLQFEGGRHHLDFRDLTGGRWVTIYAQTEIVKDLIRARLAAGAMIEFEVSDTEVGELDTDRRCSASPTPGAAVTRSPATPSPGVTGSTASAAIPCRPA